MITRAPSIISGQSTFKALDGGPLVPTNAGEANTASSAGGNSLVLPKVGVDLPFKGLVGGSNITLTPTATSIEIATTAPAGATRYEDLTDVAVAGRLDGSATHYNSVSGLYEPANEVKIDPTTRDISQITTGAVAIVGAGSVGLQSTSGNVVVAGVNADVVAPTGTVLVDGATVDIDASTALDIDSLGPVTIDTPTITTTASAGPASTFAQGPTGDVITQASRFIVATGAQGANLTATTGDAQLAATAGTAFVYGQTLVDVDGNDVQIDAATGNVDINAPSGLVDVDASVVAIDSTGVFTMGSGGALTATAAGAMSLRSTGGSAGIQSDTSVASLKGNSVSMTNNGLRFVEIDAANALNSNADGFNLNSIGGTNNFSVNSQGGASMVSATNTTIQATSGGITLRALGFNSPNRIFINPDGPLDASTFQTINLQAGQSFTCGGLQWGAVSTNVSYLQTNGAGAQVESRSSNNQGLFVCRTASTSTPSFSVSPIGNGLTYDIYTDASYTAPSATSLINKTQLEARVPDGVQGAVTPQDPFGQALIWNGTAWKAGSAIQGAPNEVATLISNGTGDVVLTAAGTGNIDIDSNDVASTVDINAGGLSVPVGGAPDPTVKANNNTFASIYGQGSAVDLAVLTKDFLNNLLASRSFAEWDSHGNTAVTPLNTVAIGTYLPFATPTPVYAVSENISAEWTNTNAPDPSVFIFTRAGAGGLNVLFQFSFTVTVIGASTGINNDQIEFELWVDQGAGFVAIPTSHFSQTISGNNDASIVSSTALARLNSGWKIQPRIRNNTGARDMLIESFKLSIAEQLTGFP